MPPSQNIALKQHQPALESFDKSLDFRPKYASAHTGKIHILILLKRCQQARAAVKTAEKKQVKLQAAIFAKLKKCGPGNQ
ncbi:MAG: hypothetical protein HAW58_02005 [Candidatus Thioglobus sp.]|nr:hypothetical protein [Candidatus Thioglobus sp.]